MLTSRREADAMTCCGCQLKRNGEDSSEKLGYTSGAATGYSRGLPLRSGHHEPDTVRQTERA